MLHSTDKIYVHRKMMQKKTVQTASPKIVRPVYTKPEKPAGYVSAWTKKGLRRNVYTISKGLLTRMTLSTKEDPRNILSPKNMAHSSTTP
jgi:hypothetical protein